MGKTTGYSGLLNLVASLATPAVAWIGGAVVLTAKGDPLIATQFFWHSILCGFIAVGSILVSAALFPVARHMALKVHVPNVVFVLLFATASVPLVWSLLTPGALATSTFIASGIFINTMCFIWLADGSIDRQHA